MKIAIFKELTTEDQLCQLEESAAKYDGLYVDMENKEERKFVKDKAYDIQQLLKKVDRKRIDESKNYKLKVEEEASAIKQRLEDANAPFMILINQHKVDRAKILAEEKAIEDAKALKIQIEDDHESAIMQNKVYDMEKNEAAVNQLIRDEEIRAEAVKQAKIDAERDAAEAEEKRLHDVEQARINEINRQKQEKETAEREEAARKANQEHVTAISSDVKLALMLRAELTEEQAIKTVKAIRAGLIINTTINF